jgi:hypothetical protein
MHVKLSLAAAVAVEHKSDYANYYWHMGRFIAKLMNRGLATPEGIARRILRLMRQKNPPLRLPIHIDARFFTLITRILPRYLYHGILYHQLPGIQKWGTGDHSDLRN